MASDYGITTADIIAEVGHLVLGANTVPTSTQVTAWITAEAYIMDAMLGPLSVTDIDATLPEGRAVCGRVIIQRVAARTVAAREGAQGADRARDLRSGADALADAIRKRLSLLGDAMPTAAGTAPMVQTTATGTTQSANENAPMLNARQNSTGQL